MTAKATSRRDYVPGFTFDVLLPLYDLVQRLVGIPRLHQLLVEQAELNGGDRVLEVGCGTGNLAVRVASTYPDIEVVGVDPDELALARARRKAGASSAVLFEHAYGQNLPYQDDSFDHAFSAFMYHHLDAATKLDMLREIARVLRPGGVLHFADFGGIINPGDGLMLRLQRRLPLLQDNLDDAIPRTMGTAGFGRVIESASRSTAVGKVTFYRATIR